MSEQKFKAVLTGPEMAGTWTYILLPFSVVELFGTGSQVKVRGTINGVPYRSSAMPEGDGTHYMVVNKGIRDQAGVTRGSEVEVVMDIDSEPREVEIPPELNAALADSVASRSAFEKLSYSHQNEYCQWIREAKKEETKLRRAEKAIEMLQEGKRLKS